MFDKTWQYYDDIYCKALGKDYGAECERVAALLDEVRPGARTVLDVACGTGEHARILSETYRVDGCDLEPGFVEAAAAKCPAGRFEVADMADFDMGARYDAVLCLFSSIGYVKTLRNLDRALACMAAHVADDGVLLVEPWFTPDVWSPGRTEVSSARAEDGTLVVRTSHSGKEGTMSLVTFEYTLGTTEGLTRATEVHELGLFTREQTETAFARAGLAVAYRDEGIMGRGLYIGSRPEE